MHLELDPILHHCRILPEGVLAPLHPPKGDHPSLCLTVGSQGMLALATAADHAPGGAAPLPPTPSNPPPPPLSRPWPTRLQDQVMTARLASGKGEKKVRPRAVEMRWLPPPCSPTAAPTPFFFGGNRPRAVHVHHFWYKLGYGPLGAGPFVLQDLA